MKESTHHLRESDDNWKKIVEPDKAGQFFFSYSTCPSYIRAGTVRAQVGNKSIKRVQ